MGRTVSKPIFSQGDSANNTNDLAELGAFAANLGDSAVQEQAEELRTLAGSSGSQSAMGDFTPDQTLALNIQQEWETIYGPNPSLWPDTLKDSLETIKVGIGLESFGNNLAASLQNLRLEEETVPAFDAAMAVVRGFSPSPLVGEGAFKSGFIPESAARAGLGFVSSPAALVLPMWAGGVVGRLTSGLVTRLGSVLGVSTESVVALAQVLGLVTESAGFVKTGDAIQYVAEGFSPPSDSWNPEGFRYKESFIEETAAATALFGMLRVFGWAGRITQSLMPATEMGMAIAKLTGHASSVFGLAAAEDLQEAAGIAPATSTTFYEGLWRAFFLHVTISGVNEVVKLGEATSDFERIKQEAERMARMVAEKIFAGELELVEANGALMPVRASATEANSGRASSATTAALNAARSSGVAAAAAEPEAKGEPPTIKKPPTIPPELATELGRLVFDVRELFIKHNRSEARVSLREVKRIKEHIEKFAQTVGLLRSVLSALWLNLGADLKPDEIAADIGQKLKERILSMNIPGIERSAVKKELEDIIEPKANEFREDLSVPDAFYEAATRNNKFFGAIAYLDFLKLRASLAGLLDQTKVTDLCEEIRGSDDKIKAKIETLGIVLAVAKNLPDAEVFGKLVRFIARSKGKQEDKKNALIGIANRRDLPKEVQKVFIDEILSCAYFNNDRGEALKFLGMNPSVQPDVLVYLFEKASAEYSETTIGWAIGNVFEGIVRNPNTPDELREQVQSFSTGKRPILDFSEKVIFEEKAIVAVDDDPPVEPLSEEELNDLREDIEEDGYDRIRRGFESSLTYGPDWAERAAVTDALTSDFFRNVWGLVKQGNTVSKNFFNGMMALSKNPNFPDDVLFELVDKVGTELNGMQYRVIFTPTFKELNSRFLRAAAKFLSNRKIPIKKYLGMLDNLKKIDFDTFLDALEHSGGAENGLSIKLTLFRGIKAIVKKIESFKSLTADAAVRISAEKGDADDLPANLKVLRSVIEIPPVPPLQKGGERSVPPLEKGGEGGFDIPILPDFDPTLVSAHNLLNKLVQALAINRFALISGPPASGKTESGRYLSEILGWKSKIVNCHKGLSQEEMMQKIGVVPNGETKFVVTDGPLAEALMNGELFILNEINLAKPGSLSFLFSILADVNETFNYYDVKEGRVVKKDIHKNFRFIGTQNTEGPGRKDINAALKNRAIDIYAPEYSDLELEALLRSKYPETKTPSPLGGEGRGEGGGDLASTLVQLYRDIARRIESQTIGGHAEGYVWNLRHLMRMAEGLSAFPPLEKGGEGGFDTPGQQVLRALYDAVGVSLTPKDRASFFDAVKTYEYNINNVAEGFSPPSGGGRLKPSATQYNAIKITDEDVAAFKKRQAKLTIREATEEFGIEDKIVEQVIKEEKIEDIPTTARLVRNVLKALTTPKLSGIWLKGPAGTGKTKVAMLAAKLLGAKLYDDTLTPQTDESQLKGDLRPALVTLKDGTKKLGFQNVPSALVNALREAERLSENVAEGFSPPTSGGTLKGSATHPDLVLCILDEAAFARPDVIEELNSLLDRDGGIWVISETGKEPEFLKRAPNFKLILASNTYGYSGVNLQSEAFRSRTKEIYVGFEYTAKELAKIINPPTPPFEKGGIKGGFDPTFFLSLAQTILSIRELFIANGKSEARISLREVKRIKEYVVTFAPTQGLTKATLNAMWLTLGADLRPDEVNGELGTEFRKKISEINIPGTSKEELFAELDKIIHLKPVEFDESKSAVENIYVMAAKRDDIFIEISYEKYISLGPLISEELSSDEVRDLIDISESLARLDEIGARARLGSEDLRSLIRKIKTICANDGDFAKSLGHIGSNPNIQLEELREVIAIVKTLDLGENDYFKIWALGELAINPNLGQAELSDLRTEITRSGSKGMWEALAKVACDSSVGLKEFSEFVSKAIGPSLVMKGGDARFLSGISSNRNISIAKLRLLISKLAILSEETIDAVHALGAIGSDKKINSFGANELISTIKGLKVDAIGKVKAFGDLGTNTNLGPDALSDLIKFIDRANVPDGTKIDALSLIATNPNLNTDDIQRLIKIGKRRGLDIDYKAKLLGRIGSNPNVTFDQLMELLSLINALHVTEPSRVEALGYIGRNPNITLGELQKLVNELKGVQNSKAYRALARIARNPSIDLGLLREIAKHLNVVNVISLQHEAGREYRQRLIAGWKTIRARIEEIKNMSADSAVRISEAKGDATDLPGNLRVLRSVIEIPPVPPLQKGGVWDLTFPSSPTLTRRSYLPIIY